MSVNYYHDTRNAGFTTFGWNASKKQIVRLADEGRRLLSGFEDELSFEDVYYGDADADEIADEFTDVIGDYIGTEHDGSVDYGFECVSQPMTLTAHIESDWIDKLCELAQNRNAIEGRNGLHVHISRAGLGQTVAAQDLAIAKMMLMLERFENKYISLARRDYNRSGWAYRVEVADHARHSDSLVEAAKDSGDDRYHSINITNRDTVEFRIFASTTNPNTLKATLELVNATATYCMTRTLNQVRDGSWDDFAAYCVGGKYKYLPKYMLRRGVLPSNLAATVNVAA